MLLAGATSLAVASASALSIASFSGIDIAGAAVAKAQSFTDLMNQRSPGKRTAAQLMKTKGKHFKMLAANVPAEIPPAVYTPVATLFAPPAQALTAPLFPAAAPFFAEAPAPFPALFLPPIGGGFLVPGAPGGGGGGPPGQPPPVTPPPIVAPPVGVIPEPGTWMTMVLGFGLGGWAMRRRRRRPGTANASF